MSDTAAPPQDVPLPVEIGWRVAGGGWRRFTLARDGGSRWATPDIDIAVPDRPTRVEEREEEIDLDRVFKTDQPT